MKSEKLLSPGTPALCGVHCSSELRGQCSSQGLADEFGCLGMLYCLRCKRTQKKSLISSEEVASRTSSQQAAFLAGKGRLEHGSVA